MIQVTVERAATVTLEMKLNTDAVRAARAMEPPGTEERFAQYWRIRGDYADVRNLLAQSNLLGAFGTNGRRHLKGRA